MTGRAALAAVIAMGTSSLAQAVPVQFLDIGNRLIRVDSATPGTITSTLALTGLQPNETILGFDYRPASPRVRRWAE